MGPELELPVVYTFAVARPPADHIVGSTILAVPLPEGSYVRGVEVGLDPHGAMLLQVRVEWSSPG